MGHAVVEWLANTEWSIALHESQYGYAVVESIHVWALCLFVGFAIVLLWSSLGCCGLGGWFGAFRLSRSMLPLLIGSFAPGFGALRLETRMLLTRWS